MKEFLARVIEHCKGKDAGLIGGGIAFSLALLLVIFGFWKTLFIVIATLIGYLIGALLFKNKDKVKEWLDKLLPPGRFR